MRCYCLQTNFEPRRVLEAEKTRFLVQIQKYAAKITWRKNFEANTLLELLAGAKNDCDVGYDAFACFFDSDCFHDWVILAQIATCLYNRDHAGDGILLCIIRMDNIYLLSTKIVYFRDHISVYYPVTVREFTVRLQMSRSSHEPTVAAELRHSGID